MAVWGYFYFQEVTCLKAPLYCWLSNWMLVDVFLTCIELTMTILLFLSFSLFLVLFRPFKSRRQRWRRAEKKGWDQKTKAKTDIRTSFPVRASTSKVHWYSLLSFTHLLYIFSSIYILSVWYIPSSLSLILSSLHSSFHLYTHPILLPVDETRVILSSGDPNIIGSDYINGNYVTVSTCYVTL